MKKLLFLLLLLPVSAWARLPEPISLVQPAYPTYIMHNIQINYAAPFLFVRFNLSGTLHCYKVDPTVPPAPTNGWIDVLNYWWPQADGTSRWLPVVRPMTAEESAWCKQ